MFSEPNKSPDEEALRSDADSDQFGVKDRGENEQDQSAPNRWRRRWYPNEARTAWCDLETGPAQMYLKQIARMMYAAGDSKMPNKDAVKHMHEFADKLV